MLIFMYSNFEHSAFQNWVLNVFFSLCSDIQKGPTEVLPSVGPIICLCSFTSMLAGLFPLECH